MYTRDEYNAELLGKADEYAALAVANREEPDIQLTDLIGRIAGCKAHRDLAGEDAAIDQLRRVLITRYVDADQLPEAPWRLPATPEAAAAQVVDAAEGLVEELSQLLNQVSLAAVLEDSGAHADAVAELRAALVGLGVGLPELPTV